MPGYSDTIRNARQTVIGTNIDAGAGPGLLRLYTGPQPARGAAITSETLLGTLTHSDPSVASVSAGLLTFDTITDDSSADNSGLCEWARSVTSTGVFCADWSVGDIGSGADIEMNNRDVVAGAPIEAVSWTILEGNGD
jgi:hypothetical protein